MTFGRPQPADHKPKAVKQPAQILAEGAAALDLRRQAQIANQKESINRLLKDGSYDREMEALHENLAKLKAAANDAIAAIRSAQGSIRNKIVLDQLAGIESILDQANE